jgi:hypothetical protein
VTLTNVRDRARRLSRTDSTFASNAEVDSWINQGKDEMSQMVGGFRKEEYLTLAARFDTEQNFAVRVTITGGTNATSATDVAITGHQRVDTTGTQVATDFQTTLRALGTISNLTVAYSTTTYKFTVDSINGTDIKFEEPSGSNYVDATSLLGLSGSSGAQTFVSSIPQDCFVETDLASTWEQIDRAEWDQYVLIRGNWDSAMSVEQQGDPAFFAVSDNMRIRVWPSPNSQKLFHVAGRGTPADITSSISFLPSQYHNGLAYYAASQIASENHEFQISDRLFRSFLSIVKRYKAARIRGDSRMGDEQIEYSGRRLGYPSSVTV